MPRWCSIAISAAISTWRGLPPRHSARPAAAIAEQTPISAWHPPIAAEIVAPFLKMQPISDAVSRKRRITGANWEPTVESASRRARRRHAARRRSRYCSDRGNHAGRAVGRRRDDAAEAGVLLVHGEREAAHPVEVSSESAAARSHPLEPRARSRAAAWPRLLAEQLAVQIAVRDDGRQGRLEARPASGSRGRCSPASRARSGAGHRGVSAAGRHARSFSHTTRETGQPVLSHHVSRSAAVSIGYGSFAASDARRRLAIAHDEAAADRVPRAGPRFSRDEVRGERERVRMERQLLQRVKPDVAGWLEVDRAPGRQSQSDASRRSGERRSADRTCHRFRDRARAARPVRPDRFRAHARSWRAHRRNRSGCWRRVGGRGWRRAPATNASAARQGPSVWELEGPTPTLNMSNTESRSDIAPYLTRATINVRSSYWSAPPWAPTSSTMVSQQWTAGMSRCSADHGEQSLLPELLSRVRRRLAGSVGEDHERVAGGQR